MPYTVYWKEMKRKASNYFEDIFFYPILFEIPENITDIFKIYTEI